MSFRVRDVDLGVARVLIVYYSGCFIVCGVVGRGLCWERVVCSVRYVWVK